MSETLKRGRQRARQEAAAPNDPGLKVAKPFDQQLEPEPPAALPELDEVDAEDLAAEGEGEPLDFLPLLNKDGYIVRGWSHLLAGSPRCGKTELLVACCPPWLSGGLRVCYMTEEGRDVWRRLGALPGLWKGMRLVFGLGEPPLDLRVRMADGPEEIVIIDTIRGLGILPQDECDNSAVAAALGPWIAAARKARKTLMLSHHMRKGGGEHGEGISGGHALLGAVDIALEIRRDNQPNRRSVRGYARLIQPDELLYEMGQDGRLVALGKAGSVGLDGVRKRLADVLEENWLPTNDIRARLEDPTPSLELLRLALLAGAEAGFVERDPPLSAGKVVGRKVRWRLAAAPPG